MEEKKKKKKLTLSVSSKKTHNFSNYGQSRGKTSVVIEKKTSRRWGERKFQTKDTFNKPKDTSNFSPPKKSVEKKFDIRKMAEERATRRFKNLKDFADLSTDELIGGYDEKKGVKYKMEGYLEEFALTKSEADDLIINARNIVFK